MQTLPNHFELLAKELSERLLSPELTPAEASCTLRQLASLWRDVGAWHATIGLKDKIGALSRVTKELHQNFDITSSLIRWQDRSNRTQRLDVFLSPGKSVAERLHQRSLLHRLLLQSDVAYVETSHNDDRTAQGAPELFIAYDFTRMDIAAIVDSRLRGLACRTGHCGVGNSTWRDYVQIAISEADAVLGILPTRDEGLSRNVVAEYRMTVASERPYVWLVAQNVDWRPERYDENVVLYSEADLASSIDAAVRRLLPTLAKSALEQELMASPVLVLLQSTTAQLTSATLTSIQEAYKQHGSHAIRVATLDSRRAPAQEQRELFKSCSALVFIVEAPNPWTFFFLGLATALKKSVVVLLQYSRDMQHVLLERRARVVHWRSFEHLLDILRVELERAIESVGQARA